MLPYLKRETGKGKKYIVNFRGLNLGEDYTDGELRESENLSTGHWPCLAPRKIRNMQEIYGIAPATTLHTKDGLLYVHGGKTDYKGDAVGTVCYKGEEIGEVRYGRKQIASVGNYILIFPDKVFYNVETKEFGSMEISFAAAEKAAVFTENSIRVEGAEFKFRPGDAVRISGCVTYPENNKTIICRGVEGDTLRFYDYSFAADEEKGAEQGAVVLKREVPDLDFICESNCRLWGTKGNTIYGSKYGDPLNFNVFDGLSGDSYYIDVGSEGAFTGCAPYASHICFFKENSLHKLYGSKPTNFQIVTSQVPGLQAGSERSLCVINETLFYKGVGGVYAYSGGVPEMVSEKLGRERFAEACAASDGEKYYISMRRGEDDWGLYVYDLRHGIWLQEDAMHCVDMAFFEGRVHFLDADSVLHSCYPEFDSYGLAWSATFCPFTKTVHERKGYSKFHLRADLEKDSYLTVEVRRDNEQRWQKLYSTPGSRARTISIPLLPKRCDSIEIRISGKGGCVLRSLVREFFVGSEV